MVVAEFQAASNLRRTKTGGPVDRGLTVDRLATKRESEAMEHISRQREATWGFVIC